MIENTSITLPLKRGKIAVSYNGLTLKVRAEGHDGTLILNGVSHELAAGKTYAFETNILPVYPASVP